MCRYRTSLISACITVFITISPASGQKISEDKTAANQALIISANDDENHASTDIMRDALGVRNSYSLHEPEVSGIKDRYRKWVNDVRKETKVAVVYYVGRANLVDQQWSLAGPGGGLSISYLIERLSDFEDPEVNILLLLDIDVPNGKLSSLKSFLTGKIDKLPITVCFGGDQPAGQAAFDFAKALRGGADGVADLPDQEVDSSEFVTFVSKQVNANVVESPTAKPFSMGAKRDLRLDEMIADLAAQLAPIMQQHGTHYVAIPDFTFEGKTAENVPGQDYGPLIRISVDKLKKELTKRSNFTYQPLERAWLRNQLQINGIKPSNIKSKEMTKLGKAIQDTAGANKTVVVLVGKMSQPGSDKSQVNIEINAWDPASGGSIGSTNGTALLTPSEWAMIGSSVVLEPPSASDIAKPVPVTTVAPKKKPRETKGLQLFDLRNSDHVDAWKASVNEMERKSQAQIHPYHPSNKSTSLPCRIKIYRNGRELDEAFSQDKRHMYVTLKRGDEYSIGLSPTSVKKSYFLGLLVDGQNTLPDYPQTKIENYTEVAVKDKSIGLQPKVHVNLNNARVWHCQAGSKYMIKGFFKEVKGKGDGRANGKFGQFTVVDAQSTAAWKDGYRADVGIITAAIYEEITKLPGMSAKPRFGTAMGEEKQIEMKTYDGKQVPGKLIGVVHIRYGF